MKLDYLKRALRHPAFFQVFSGGLSLNAFYLPLYYLDPEAVQRLHGAVLLGLIPYYGLGILFLNYRLVSGRWSLQRWLGGLRIVTTGMMLALGYVAAAAPEYGFVAFGIALGGSFLVTGMTGRKDYLISGLILAGAHLGCTMALAGWTLDVSPRSLYLPIAFVLFFYWAGLASAFAQRLRKSGLDLLTRSRKDRRIIAEERQKSDGLLRNILPEEIASELKLHNAVQPVRFESASVLFTDFQGFTKIAEVLSPEELVQELDRCFSYFDAVAERNNLEKLKTIGDSFMCAGGVPIRNRTHAIDCVLAALEIQRFMNQMKDLKSSQGLPYWELRLGIHSGPLVAGVVGEKKFAYDVWGDTVNTASRAESSGVAGRINITGATHDLVNDFFVCEHRGPVPAKHKGTIEMFFVNAIRPGLSRDGDGRVPNDEFRRLYNCLAEGAIPG
ncbi:MAG: adenylate/guanylate cyclase domain-containing protein [Spirochaetales bacterium]|nr:adenylate/guanylate cyclase domain-containing protein [Spirochaetales bacterium]